MEADGTSTVASFLVARLAKRQTEWFRVEMKGSADSQLRIAALLPHRRNDCPLSRLRSGIVAFPQLIRK